MKLGFWEILVILIVALLVIGPDKLPFYTKKLGLALKEFRKVSESVTKEVRESVIDPLDEASKPLREAMEPLEELKKDIEGNFSSVERDFKNIGKPKKSAAKKDEPKEAVAEESSAEEAPGAEESAAADQAPAAQTGGEPETAVNTDGDKPAEKQASEGGSNT